MRCTAPRIAASAEGRNPPTLAFSPTTIVVGLLRLQLDNAAAHGNRDRLGAVAGAQLLHDVLDVNLDRVFGDEEELGDVAVPIPSGDVLQHVFLAVGQGLVADVLGEMRRHFGRNALFSGMDLPYHAG